MWPDLSFLKRKFLIFKKNLIPYTQSIDLKPDPTFIGPSFQTFGEISLEQSRQAIIACKLGSPFDACPPEVLHKILDIVNPVVNKIITSSLTTAIIPEERKIAVVKPLQRKQNIDPSTLSSLRPISLLPILGKITEKLVNRQLTDFLEKPKILHPSQSDICPKHSTESALLEVLDTLKLTLDKGKNAVLILLDLSAAFDTISHSILLSRIKQSVVSSTALAWLQSFLTNCKQTVALGHFLSTERQITSGVPQGSSLSSLLFNIYTAPLISSISIQPHTQTTHNWSWPRIKTQPNQSLILGNVWQRSSAGRD